MKLDKYILNYLIDRYEKSSGYRGHSRINRRIFFRFSNKNIPRYFNETTSRYRREINGICQELEKMGFISIIWVKYEEGNLIEKVALNAERIADIYNYLGRTSRLDKEREIIRLAKRYGEETSGWLREFYLDVIDSLEKGKNPGPFLDISNLEEAEDIFKSLNAIYRLEEELPYRVFSTRVLGNSKAFEGIKKKVTGILREFAGGEGLEDDEILAEMGLVKSPSYVCLSGDITVKMDGDILELGRFKPDIGIPSAMIESFQIIGLKADYVITIENLTSYHQYLKEVPGRYVAVYLGGYHNRPRRELLVKLYKYAANSKSMLPFYHWGDIDYGGFTIFNHLKRMCCIEIKPVMMDVETLENYLEYGTRFGEGYRRALESLLDQKDSEVFRDVITLMLEKGIRLEQESIDLRGFCPGSSSRG